MRRFDFWHSARTSLGRPQRAVERSRMAVILAAATVGKLTVGAPSLGGRAPCSVALRTHTGTQARVRIGPMEGVKAEFELCGRT